MSNYPDGFRDSELEPDISDDLLDKAVEDIAERICDEAAKNGLGIDFDDVCDYGTLDDEDVRDQILEAIRNHTDDLGDWIRDIVSESVASGHLDIDAVNYDYCEY